MGDTGEISVSVDGAQIDGPVDPDDDNPTPGTRTQSGWLIGPAVGLSTAAVLCCVYAWVFRTPDNPSDGLGNTMSVLVRTSTLVVTSAVLVAACLIVGRAHQRSERRRARFLALVAPAPAVIGVGGLYALHRAGTADIFDMATREQITLPSHHILVAARVAWWCACLALIVCAVVAMLAHFRGVDRDWFQRAPRRPILIGTALAVVIPVIITSVTVLIPADRSPFKGENASSVAIPGAPRSADAVRYRTSAGWAIPAGAGFIRITKSETGEGADIIGGYAGQTGERLWWFSAEALTVKRLWSTGTGDSSVVVADVRQYPVTTISGSPFVGIDATTGKHLWTAEFDSIVERDRMLYGRSNSVVILPQELPEPGGTTAAATGTRWLAIAPRSGEVMWSKDFRYTCHPQGHVTDDAVVLSSCSDDRDLIASVLDPLTGQTRADIRYSTLGQQLPKGTTAKVQDARGNLALMAFDTYSAASGDHSSSAGLLDLGTGRLTQTFADTSDTAFIDNDSVLLTTYLNPLDTFELSIFRISDRTEIPTGLYHRDPLNPADAQPGFPAAALDEGWVVQAAAMPVSRRSPGPNTAGLHLISATGPATELFPCRDDPPRGPLTVPGALLIHCGHELFGLN